MLGALSLSTLIAETSRVNIVCFKVGKYVDVGVGGKYIHTVGGTRLVQYPKLLYGIPNRNIFRNHYQFRNCLFFPSEVILSEFQGEGGVPKVETPYDPRCSLIAFFTLELKFHTTSFYSSFVFLKTTSARLSESSSK